MYQVLYRKYRPKVFSDVYGQDHITFTLKNEIKNSRVSHAYLFTGSRGTGKTTCAKILAKAVNCQHPVDGEPCGECECCKAIDSGAVYDVVEIDAASNNGVNDIRDLRDETNYTPTKCKYKVYIVDEVHMLTNQAFNALLKTLEEPPAHIMFILATTEVHKIPATILSRCQRFDFKRIMPETMAERLSEVSRLEGITLEDDAATLIARIADGALRDGLSILDQCAGRSKLISSKLVSDVAGIASNEALYKLSECIANRDSNTAMSIISELYQGSFDMERLCVEMINHFRNFLVVKTVSKSRELIICTDDEYATILKSADLFTTEGVIRSLDLFQETLVTIKRGATARIEMEMAFVRLCEPKLDSDMSSLFDRLSAVERAVKNPVRVSGADINDSVKAQESVSPSEEEKQKIDTVSEKTEETFVNNDIGENEEISSQPSPYTRGEKESDTIPPTETVFTESAPTIESDASIQPTQPVQGDSQPVEFMQWGDFMDVLQKEDIALFGVLSGARGFVKDDIFLIDSPNKTVDSFIHVKTHSRAVRKALYDVTGIKYRLGIFVRKDESTAPARDPLEDLISKAQGSINIEIK